MVEQSLKSIVLNQVSSSDYKDGKCLTANRDTRPNEALFAIPLKDLLSLKRIQNENGKLWQLVKAAPEVCEEDESAFELVVMTLFLMYESLEVGSDWNDYLNSQMDKQFFCDWHDDF